MVRSRIQPDNPKKGVIARIRCRNFITYSEVEVCPGENLNIILGPNGTGKSTLVCAIVLGLGGKTEVIGKSKELSQYIKTGHKEATIEIHLNNPDGDDYVIMRRFSKENNNWFLNGAKVPQKRIDKVVKECKIQVDNLCQFLPQERVQDFAKMNAKELLEQTLRSVDNGELAVQLDELKQKRKEQVDVQKHLETLIRNLENETQINANLEGEVRNAAERENLVKKLETMKQKQAFILYQNKKHFIEKLAERLKEEKKAGEDHQKTQANYDREIAQKRRQISQQEEAVSNLANAGVAKVTELRGLMQASRELSDKIEDTKSSLLNKLKMEERREEDMKTVRTQIERLMNDLPESDESEKRKLYTISANLQEKKEAHNQLKSKEEDYLYEIRNKEHEIQATQQQIIRESNTRNVKYEILKRQQYDGVQQMVQWLRTHKGDFSQEVFEPIFTQINVAEGYGKYVENAVPNRDLLAFTCQNGADSTRLIRQSKQLKLYGVNVVTAPPPQDKPAKEFYKPQIPLNQIRRYGFETYLLDVIDGPEPILRYLANNFRLNNMPVGGQAVERNHDSIPESFPAYFSADSRFSVRRSKYSGNKNFSSSAVNNAFLLQVNQNNNRLQELEAQQARSKQIKEDLVSKKNALQSELREMEKEVEDLTKQRNEVKQKLDQQRIIISKIEQKKRQLADLDRGKIDPDIAKQEFKESTKRTVLQILNAKRKIIQACSTIENSTGEVKLQKLVLSGLKDTLRQKQQEAADFKKSIKEALEQIRRLEDSVAEEQENKRILLRKAIELCKGAKPGTPAFQPYDDGFKELPDDQDELESVMLETQAKVDIIGGTNPESLRDYEKRKKKIAELENQKTNLERNFDDMAGRLGSIRERWYHKVRDLINKIDAKFREYFASFNCGGQVELYEGENESNYDEYGIRVMVRFRDNTELQALDAHTQSGGERAVSTAIYMLSLQELTDVPFRVVDEINQGMDSSNERRVFDLLVSTITTTNSAQYFLLTPKLLENLSYSDATTVLNVHNGAFVMDYKLWDVQDFLEARSRNPAKRRKRSDSYNDENLDTNRMQN